jgi:hypothetical protein
MRWWRWCAVTAVLAALVTPAMAPAATSDLAHLHIGDAGEGYGFNIWGLDFDPTFRARVAADVKDAGFGWVRQQVIWAAMESQPGNFGTDFTAQMDLFIADTSAKGLKILLSVARSPDWAGANGGLPKQTGDFTTFMTFLTQRYKGKVQAYEIWNEPNYAYETGGHVAVGDYLPVLKAGYQTVKANDPAALVLFAGLTPTGVNDPSVAISDVEYLRQMYALNGGEVRQYYDALGAHAGSTCNPPDNSYPDNPATNPCGTDPDGGRSYTKDNSFYFKRIVQLRGVMEQNGEGAKPMWLTEFGWDSTPSPPPGYGFARYNSEAQQAAYLTRALDLGRSYPWMGAMFVWNLNFAPIAPADEKAGWGVLRSDWSPRPAYGALAAMQKVNPPAPAPTPRPGVGTGSPAPAPVQRPATPAPSTPAPAPAPRPDGAQASGGATSTPPGGAPAPAPLPPPR